MPRRASGTSGQNDRDADKLLEAFGQNLRAARLNSGLTQADLAERAGLLQQYVSLVESGKQNVTLTTAQALARVVGRDVSDMLRRVRPRSRRP